MGDDNTEEDQTPTGRVKALVRFAVDEIKGEIKSSEERIIAATREEQSWMKKLIRDVATYVLGIVKR